MFQKVLPYRFGGILYVITRLLLDIQTLVFGPTFFAYTTFGPDPRGFMGWMLVIIFYSAIAFLFSWVGSMVMLRFQKHNQVL